ncbi:nucleotide disphospho-sugar-binding domain-containing protein [Rhodococcus sp. IEGM 1379]|uniref:glycosyltransferase n=1 Tax=Rhodococcus sp. IEGM 1379 TaxID=3047086 RepID=UPI0024B7061A|nr:nucleotide disphospho-sugar-binding domain-containing protein [Rhodococcus sp. IEGM 1379]MDI9918824.1 glycosyl transferase [Rhodococcus sp. IEGM 1379]
MRVAVVAGPDPGHAFPAIALSLALIAAGDEPILFTGSRWVDAARAAGVETEPLKGLAPRPGDDDLDAGARIHGRAAYISTELLPDLRAVSADLVVSDILTAGGGLAAEQLGIPWVELSPHPLYSPSRGLPPIGSGLAPGVGLRGRLRDTLMRAATGRSIKQGLAQRSEARVSVGLPAVDPGPAARLIATLPALEVPRPDWPEHAHLVGPLLWEPTEKILEPSVGSEPLVMVAPSTAHTGAVGMLEAAVDGLEGAGVRLVASVLEGSDGQHPEWVRAGLGRQDVMLRDASVLVCGGGHGMLAKAMLAGVPTVIVPGGGDQWELANRAARGGGAVIVRPADAGSIRDAVLRVLADSSFAEAARAAAKTASDVRDPVAVCREVVAGGVRA